MPELKAAPSISSLASPPYDGLDLETICFPLACIQLSLGQQSPFQLQPLGTEVGNHLPLSSLQLESEFWLQLHANKPEQIDSEFCHQGALRVLVVFWGFFGI